MTNKETEEEFDKKIIKEALKTPEDSARVVKLIYVTDKHLSIQRKGQPKKFFYVEADKKIRDEETLERIKNLVIPPAWSDVRICKLENGHLQCIGYDVAGRKQYRYHNLWSAVRNHTKYYRMLEFGERLPEIRKKLEKDLSLSGYPREKVLAAVVILLELTNIRIGNISYEKLYGSFGLTTMKNRHVKLDGAKLIFSFTGKKGIKHNITLKSKRLSKIVRGCKDIPGKELFEYVDDQGSAHNIDSGMVNDYIKEISGGEFTAKDFRTWEGSLSALLALNEVGVFETESGMKHKLKEAFESVAADLGNTVAVCKKYYIHPQIIKLYEEGKLDKYINGLEENNEEGEMPVGLNEKEKILMKILKNRR